MHIHTLSFPATNLEYFLASGGDAFALFSKDADDLFRVGRDRG